MDSREKKKKKARTDPKGGIPFLYSAFKENS